MARRVGAVSADHLLKASDEASANAGCRCHQYILAADRFWTEGGICACPQDDRRGLRGCAGFGSESGKLLLQFHPSDGCPWMYIHEYVYRGSHHSPYHQRRSRWLTVRQSGSLEPGKAADIIFLKIPVHSFYALPHSNQFGGDGDQEWRYCLSQRMVTRNSSDV